MDQMFRLMMRMAIWVRRPPSRRHLWVLGVVALVAVFCFAFEALFGWPEWLTVQRPPRSLVPRP